MKNKGVMLPILTLAVCIVFNILLCAGCKVQGENSPSPVTTQTASLTATPTPKENLPDQEIIIMGQEGIQIYVTDPLGQNLGIDPSSGTIVNEIPESEYEDNPSWGYDASRGDTLTDPAKIVTARILHPMDGLYLILAHGKINSQEGGGIALSAWHNGDVKAMRMAYIDFDQTLPIKYQFTFSSDNQELVTELVIVEN